MFYFQASLLQIGHDTAALDSVQNIHTRLVLQSDQERAQEHKDQLVWPLGGRPVRGKGHEVAPGPAPVTH